MNFFLSQLREDCEIILLDDFNICYGDQKGPLFKSYDSVLKIFNLCQMIKQPTRETEFTSSVIDHILCNNPEKNGQSGVLNRGISDHVVVYCTRKLSKSSFNKHNNVKVRSVKSYNKDVFIEKLAEANWESCFFASNINEALSNFKDIFTNILDTVAPLKEIIVKQKTETWITSDILECIYSRDKLCKKFQRSKILKITKVLVN